MTISSRASTQARASADQVDRISAQVTSRTACHEAREAGSVTYFH